MSSQFNSGAHADHINRNNVPPSRSNRAEDSAAAAAADNLAAPVDSRAATVTCPRNVGARAAIISSPIPASRVAVSQPLTPLNALVPGSSLQTQPDLAVIDRLCSNETALRPNTAVRTNESAPSDHEDLEEDEEHILEGGVESTLYEAVRSEDERDPNWTPAESSPNRHGNPRGSRPTTGESGSSNREKRRYIVVSRSKRTVSSSSSSRREKWAKQVEQLTESRLRQTRCCASKKCFQVVDFPYFVQRAKALVSASPSVRRATLNGFRSSDGSYYFDGKPVCVRFLKLGFHFSTYMISGDKDGSFTQASSTTESELFRFTSSFSSPRTSTNSSTRSSSIHSSGAILPNNDSDPVITSGQKSIIISFLIRLSEDCSDKIPNKPEVHLPFFRRSDVYIHFLNEHNTLYPNNQPPSSAYFMRVWRRCVDHIKVRRNHGFTMCDECDELRRALHLAITQSQPTDMIMEKKSNHLAFVNRERMAYALNRDRARLEPSKYLSCIIDGADQSAFGLPHFITPVKSARGHALKVKLVGVLHHCVPNQLHLYTMTEEHETGANHIVETLHRFINMRSSFGPLPRTIFIQLDNCSRENKNHFLLSYLESLVALKVFDVVEVGFLPIGHTHEDIDQTFSSTSSRLRVNDAVTLNDLHFQLSQTHGKTTRVTHMKRIINWSGLCNQEACIRKVAVITQYRYFKFCRAPTAEAVESDNKEEVFPVPTQCLIKRQSRDEWTAIRNAPDESTQQGLLRFCPSLKNFPSTVIQCPDGKDDFIKRLASEEGRINDAQKMLDLEDLKEHVFRDRIDKAHWDLSNIIETKEMRLIEAAKSRLRKTSTHRSVEQINNGNDDADASQEEIQIEVQSTNQYQNQGAQSEVNASEINQAGARNATGLSSNGIQKTRSPPKRVDPPSTQVNYCIGNFVLVNTGTKDSSSASSTEFWVAKIIGIEKKKDEAFVRSIRVHWYDQDLKKGDVNVNAVNGKYFPSYKSGPKRQKTTPLSSRTRRSPNMTAWHQTIDTDTVVMTFESLKKNHTLPMNVQNRLLRY